MASKKNRLLERVAQTTRRPAPQRLLDEPKARKKGYKIVAISLYTPEAEWADSTSDLLKRAGNAKANRSLVVREALLRLQEELEGKSPEQVLQYFLERQARRTAERA